MTTLFRRTANVFCAVLIAVASVNLIGVSQVYASQDRPEGRKIRICHATNSTSNPYSSIEVSLDSVDGWGHNDHADHNGPVFTQGMTNRDNWGDIIPAGYGANSKNWNAAGQAIWNNNCNIPTPNVPVTPSAPRFEDVCGTVNDKIIITSTNGVKYTTGVVELAVGANPGVGSGTVVATALSGYVLTGTSSWSYAFDATPCVVTVSVNAPSRSVEVCGIENDKYTIPVSEGVDYYVGSTKLAAGTYDGLATVVIRAQPQAGYVLAGQTEWTFVFDSTPCIIPVTEISAPTVVDECGKKNDKLIVPSTVGVRYLVNGNEVTGDYKVTGEVVVKAEAIAGYELAEGVNSEWSYKLSKKQCKVTICHATDSRTNPYVKIRVSKKAVDGKGKNDHTSHTGPIFNIELPKGANWGDIIPEVSGVTSQNWTEAGQAIWNADCEVEVEEPEEPKYPNIRADFVCTASGIVVTVGNDGDADGFAVVNGDKVELAPGESKDVLVEVAGRDRSADVLVYDQGEDTLVDRLVVCLGQGGEEPTVPTTPAVPALPVVTPVVAAGQMPTEMPQTGASNQLAQFIATLALAAATYVATYYLQGRRKLDANE